MKSDCSILYQRRVETDRQVECEPLGIDADRSDTSQRIGAVHQYKVSRDRDRQCVRWRTCFPCLLFPCLHATSAPDISRPLIFAFHGILMAENLYVFLPKQS